MPVKKEISRSGWHEALGILLLAGCVLSFLSLASYEPKDIALLQSPPNSPPANFIGPVGAWFGFLAFMLFGICGYIVPAAFAFIGLICLFKREGRIWPKAAWMLALLLAVSLLAELQAGTWEALRAKLNVGGAGGLLGEIVGERFLIVMIGNVGTAIVAVTAILIALVMLFGVRPLAVMRYVAEHTHALYEHVMERRRDRMDRKEQIEDEEREIARRRRRLEEAMRSPGRRAGAAADGEPAPVKMTRVIQTPEEQERAVAPAAPAKARADKAPRPEEPEPEEPLAEAEEPRPVVDAAVKLVKAMRRPPTVKTAEPAGKDEAADAVMAACAGNFTLPPTDLLDALPAMKDREIKGDFAASAQVLKETFADFGIEVEVMNVERGPVVTRYELLPAAGVRVERIAGLSNNIALAMKAESVRVQAPIPGKGVVGIEVPNPKTTTVYLREIMESDAWVSSRAALPLALGKDVGGHVIIADLAEMPHMLVAGATGSGKTVCMNSILAGLLMSRTPDQMRLMLIDPKIVEFAGYNHLPHLVVPVITDSKKVSLGLRWAINEMEKRYKLFAKVGVRNIRAFNSRPILKQEELFPAEPGVAPSEEPAEKIPDRVPYIVIVVDELADLMLVAQAEVENSIARLAQLSRAVGIHMILATQRPSVNVITGTIKANFPARISFQVAQKVDSRTILDAAGADKLLGKGDMLFLPPGSAKLIRAQGTLTTDAEIHRIVDHVKSQGAPQYETAIKDKIEGKSADLPDMEEDDEIIQQAMEIIRQTRRASTSSLQRRLRIGYTRAARVMDLLEQRGVVGPAQGSDPREILIDLDGEIPQNEMKEAE